MPADMVPVLMPTQGGSAVVACDDRPTDRWMNRVAAEFDWSDVVFVWCSEGDWAAAAIHKGGRKLPRAADLERGVKLLARDGRIGPDGRVVFRCDDPSSPGLPVAISATAREDNEDEVLDELLTDDGISAWIEKHNAGPLRQIVQSLRSAMGVIPFLGAGMSYPFNYPLWGQFFHNLATAATDGKLVGAQRLSAADRDAVIAFVETQQFEKAADILVAWDRHVFYGQVRHEFSKQPAPNKPTPLTRLPQIAQGPIITTNFDPVIETVYRDLGRPFADDRRILGARKYPDQVVTALQQNWTALIKLHGDADDPESLVFTGIEYEQGYGDIDSNPGPIERLASVIYTNRPLLFLGCSLETDRTLTSLINVFKRNPYIGHYAVLPAYYRASLRMRRIDNLDAAGIRALWYRPGRYDDVDDLLDAMVEATAVDEITNDPMPEPTVPDADATAPSVNLDNAPTDHWPDLSDDHIASVVERLTTGELVFFVGSAVHSHRHLHGQTFYEEICRRAAIPWPSRDRTDAAQYLADLDRNLLSDIVSELIHRDYTEPDTAHHYLAALASRLKALDVAPLTILTTNYDAAIESAFDMADEPYHLFTYNHSGPYAGRFLYRRPDGREYAIRSPAAITRPLAEPCIVKLNGGIDPRRRWPENFVVASSDFEELSTRLPNVLPQVIWDSVRKRSMVFIGHGLREPDVRSLIRRRKFAGAPTSWALQIVRSDTEYWRAVGIDVIQADLHAFFSRLESALIAALPPAP